MSKQGKPYIVTCGTHGRCVIYGYAEAEPKHGEPVRLTRARMVLYWPAGGIFGLAQNGPPDGSRISAAVEFTTTSPAREVLAVSPKAAAMLDRWDA